MADCILLGSGGGGFGSDDVTATKNHVLSPYTAITSDSGDEPVAGTIPSVGAGTFYATAGEQTILQAGRYLLGAQKLAKLTATNLSAANILRGKTITINNGNANVWSVTGSNNILKMVSGQTTLTNSTVSIDGKAFKYKDIAPGITPVLAVFLTDATYSIRTSPTTLNYCDIKKSKQGYVTGVSNAPMNASTVRLLGDYKGSDNYVLYWIFGY